MKYFFTYVCLIYNHKNMPFFIINLIDTPPPPLTQLKQYLCWGCLEALSSQLHCGECWPRSGGAGWATAVCVEVTGSGAGGTVTVNGVWTGTETRGTGAG